MKLNWGNYIAIFIGLFLTLCTIFIIFSLKQNRDLVTENYYESGADYTSQMEISERSLPFADSIDVIIATSQIKISLPISVSKKSTSIESYFYRPSDKSDDYKVSSEEGVDTIMIDRVYLKRGRYILKLTWTMEGEPFLVEKEIFIN